MSKFWEHHIDRERVEPDTIDQNNGYLDEISFRVALYLGNVMQKNSTVRMRAMGISQDYHVVPFQMSSRQGSNSKRPLRVRVNAPGQKEHDMMSKVSARCIEMALYLEADSFPPRDYRVK